jgi:hypothetical protein
VGIRRVDGRLFVLRPSLAAALSIGIGGTLGDRVFVVAQLVKHRSMLNEHCLERRCMAWDLVGQNLEMPVAEELLGDF